MVRGSGSEDPDFRIWILNYARSPRPQAKLSSALADEADRRRQLAQMKVCPLVGGARWVFLLV